MTEGGKRALFAGLLRLVPYSGVQFRDVEIPRELCDRLKTRFIEEQFDDDGMSQRILLPLEDCKPAETVPPAAAPADDAEPAIPGDRPLRPRPILPERLIHPVTGKPVDPASIMEVTGASVVECFAGRWMPLPYLRFIGRDAQQRPTFDAGPTNWARAYFTPVDADPAAPIRVTLAFDTSLMQQSRLDTDSYLAPNTDDAAFGSTFLCASSVDEISTLLGEPWVETWLAAAMKANARPTTEPQAAEPTAAELDYHHLPIARYLTCLRLLASAGVMPEVRFTDTIQHRYPITNTSVDLILDIGDSETTALLVDVPSEAPGEFVATAGYAELLHLRDLSEPNVSHSGPFPTAAEFDAAPFGDANLSRESGRLDAFTWPSLVRIGHEARRLALRGNGTEGVTGLSNLRSFLLDDNASPGLWRQSTNDSNASEAGPMVSGTMLDHVSENGALLGVGFGDLSLTAIADQRPAIRPRFSRASMIGFFASELVMHALAQINSTDREHRDAHDSEVRTLRQVVVLAPATLSEQESQALLSRVDQGLVLAWRGLGWEHSAAGMPPRPVVTLGLGGDLGTQIAYLHNEVTAKYQGRFRDLLRVYRGGDMAGGAAEVLRVASVDFGARATTLSIVDYAAAEGPVVASEWQPNVRAQERLPVGVDSALQAMIWALLLPAIEHHLGLAGLSPARHFLDEITGRSSTSLLVEDPYFTRRLNRKVLWPAAQGLLALYQHGATSLMYGNRSVAIATLVELGGGRMDTIGAAFDTAALQAGARGFSLESTKIDLDRDDIARIIRTEMQDCVQQICRLVATHSCDLMLLAGEGTRLSPICDAVLAALPLPASRIIDLNTHHNRAANEAVAGAGRLPTPNMLPAIASALDRRQLLEGSGFGHLSLRRLTLPSAVGATMSQRALGAPVRDTATDRSAERASPGRTNAIPAKGG